ncbi:MAG: hypothetical protein QM630_00610 [Microbacterium sp.]
MCATNLWVINSAAFTPEFTRFTADRLGVAPTPSAMRISSSRVRNSSIVFTLIRRMCDCDTLVGRRNDPPVDGEISAEAWLTWLRDLPAHVPHVSHIAIMRAWSPEDDVIAPTRARGIQIGELTEDVLRDVRDDNLLTIDYPRAE